MKITLILLFTFSILTVSNISSQNNDVKENEFSIKFDEYIHKLMNSTPEIPSIAVVVIKDEDPVFLKTYGMSDKEKGVKADENTLYYIASSTKSFTALTAAMIDEEGMIKLNDPIIKYCVGITFYNIIPKYITVQELLTHTSGLHNEPLTFRYAYSGESDRDDLKITFAGATGFIDSNYKVYNYDNLGYNIYTMLLQEYSEKNWKDEIQTRIFDPLGMMHSTSYISKAIINNWSVAVPYVMMPVKGVARSWLEKKDNNMQSAGGIYSSISDMGKWLSININKGRLNGNEIIPEELILKCQTGYTNTVRDQQPFPGEGQYGLGWQIGKFKNEKVLYHNGGFPGYASNVSFLPEKKTGIVVLTNESSAGGRANNLLTQYVYDWWLNNGNIDEAYEMKLQEFKLNFEKLKEAIRTGYEERSKRTSQLSKPIESYTGKFYNTDAGTMVVYISDGQLGVKIGNMNCIATHYKEKESVRVELIPGSGEALYFKADQSNNKITAVVYRDILFDKTDQ